MLRSRVGALLLRPCSDVALLCNHDNKELQEDVDGCAEVGEVELVHGLFIYHIRAFLSPRTVSSQGTSSLPENILLVCLFLEKVNPDPTGYCAKKKKNEPSEPEQ